MIVFFSSVNLLKTHKDINCLSHIFHDKPPWVKVIKRSKYISAMHIISLTYREILLNQGNTEVTCLEIDQARIVRRAGYAGCGLCHPGCDTQL